MTIRLNRKRTSGRTTIIRAIIRLNGRKYTVSTGIQIETKDWDAKRECCRSDSNANQKLAQVRTRIKQFIERHGRPPEKHELHHSDNITILEAVNRHRARKVTESTSPHTWRAYSTLSRNLEWYHEETSRREPYLHEISQSYIEGFLLWLNSNDYATGHVAKMLRTLRTVIRRLVPAEIWQDIRPPTAKPRDEIYLTTHEIRLLETIELPEHLDRARDLFLLGAYTAQRYSDWHKITSRRVQIVQKTKVLMLSQQKTDATVTLPVTAQMERIWNKYPQGLPKLSNQKMNQYIKEIARTAGITQLVDITEYRSKGTTTKTVEKWKMATTHTARRSFATNAFLADIPIYVIMRFTGHKTETEFLRYIRASGQEIAAKFATHPFFTGKYLEQ